MPIILSPCRFIETKSISQFQSVNPPDKPLNAIPRFKQEETLLKVSRAIERILISEQDLLLEEDQEKNVSRNIDGKTVAEGDRSSGQPVPESSSIHGVRFFKSSGEYGIASDWLQLLQQTEKIFYVMGLTLGAWRRTSNFKSQIIQKANTNCKVRILLMHPENPALERMVFSIDGEENYASVVHDINQSLAFYKSIAQESHNIEIRQTLKGFHHFYLTLTDECAIMVQHFFSYTWGNGPLWECSRRSNPYDILKKEFETLWQLNEPEM